MPHKDPIKRKEYDKNYWIKNREKRTSQHKKWVENNLERSKELFCNWVKNNPDKMKAYNHKLYLKNRDKILLKQAKHHKENLESVRAIARKSAHKNRIHRLVYDRRIRATNVNIRITHSLRARVNTALRLQKGSKNGYLEELLGISISELRTYLENLFQEGMSWENYGTWHIDHIKPLSKHNLVNVSEQHKACHFTNLQPLWAVENLSKGAKIL